MRVAADNGGGQQGGRFHLEDEQGNNLSGSIKMPDTGGWQNWQTVGVKNITLPAGQQRLRLVMEANNAAYGYVGNFDYLTFVLSSGQGEVQQSPSTVVPTSAATMVETQLSMTGTLSPIMYTPNAVATAAATRPFSTSTLPTSIQTATAIMITPVTTPLRTSTSTATPLSSRTALATAAATTVVGATK